MFGDVRDEIRDERLVCPDCGSEAVTEINDHKCKCTECLTVENRSLFTLGELDASYPEPVAEVGDTVRVEWTVLGIWNRSEELTVDKVCEDGVYEKRDGMGWKFVPHRAFYDDGWFVVT